MDRANDSTDAFVEIKLGGMVQKTDVCRRSLNPQWNSDWFRFEVQDDADLQDEPLQLRVMDHDTYSAHDAIGKVYLSLSPLLVSEWSEDSPVMISGWMPIYDTLHGIRGEINIMVKVDLFTDYNKFKQSSCGVRFFSCVGVPSGLHVQQLIGFVEQLVVNDDPEYQWIDKIRTPRASNETRQALFCKLSGQVQRRIGMSTIEAGGNAVIGYQQCFDLEGESGIVVRATGTAVSLCQISTPLSPHINPPTNLILESCVSSESGAEQFHCSDEADAHPNVGVISSSTQWKTTVIDTRPGVGVHQSTSDCEDPPVSSNPISAEISARYQQQHKFECSDLPLITMRSFPPCFITHIGGTVSSCSVKVLDHIDLPNEGQNRSSWWIEVRTEIRSHCRALACTAVLGYEEHTSICQDVCVLSASGTAAVVNFCALGPVPLPLVPNTTGPCQPPQCFDSQSGSLLDESVQATAGCHFCHIPYNERSLPLPAVVSLCNVCKKGRVPDVMFCTLEPSDYMSTIGRSCLVQAQVCREKADLKSEALAKEISDRLSFIEYDLHRQLINKLRIIGINALFDLRIQLTFGDDLIIALATATAVYLAALPPPIDPRVIFGAVICTDINNLEDGHQKIPELVNLNRSLFRLPDSQLVKDTCEIEQDQGTSLNPDLELAVGNKETCVLEVDDKEDIDILCGSFGWQHPAEFELVTSRSVPGIPNGTLMEDKQLFTRCLRIKLPHVSNQSLGQVLYKLTQCLCFKMRKFAPCALCGIRFGIDAPEGDEIQISVYGCVIRISAKEDSKDCCLAPSIDLHRPISALTISTSGSADDKIVPLRAWRNGLDVIITPLDCIAGAQVDRHLGYLNCFFIRECASLREVGGLDCFVQSLITEVLAVIRAHVSCLGGNAILAYFLSHCVLLHNPHKNQAQCLVNLGGDMVHASYTTAVLSE